MPHLRSVHYRGAVRVLTQWTRQHHAIVDCVLAVSLFAVGVLSVRVIYDITVGTPSGFRFATGVALVGLLTLPTAVRRRHAPLALVCVTASIVLYSVFGVTENTMGGTTAFLAIFWVGAFCQPIVANWVRGVCIAVLLGDVLWLVLVREIDVANSKASVVLAGLLSVGANVFFFAAAWVVGDIARTSRLRAAELAVVNAELREAQTVIAEQSVLDERVRISRELHDVVAHHVSVMGVQAGAARRVMARSPEEAVRVLSNIEESSRQAVAEMHRLLGFLRRENDVGSSGSGAAPQPGLSALDELTHALGRTGLSVSINVLGVEAALPAGIDLSVYRIVQEALTNALKHGGPGTIATVEIALRDGELTVAVTDDGRGRSNARAGVEPAPISTGHGLIGMRERTVLHGGTFHAGPLPGSGFAVTATFPIVVGARVLA
ncbi:MAG: histidine kinase [Acidimicrobiales bacterium]|nr:histidine kinase [Acidimicrobiales bacterium]